MLERFKSYYLVYEFMEFIQKPETRGECSILLVDDEDLVMGIFRRYLQKAGYSQIFSASNGREALEKYGNRRFNLYGLDCIMPEMGGKPLWGEIKKRHLDARAFVASAHPKDWTRDEMFYSGIDALFDKPINWPFFIPVIDLLTLEKVSPIFNGATPTFPLHITSDKIHYYSFGDK